MKKRNDKILFISLLGAAVLLFLLAVIQTVRVGALKKELRTLNASAEAIPGDNDIQGEKQTSGSPTKALQTLAPTLTSTPTPIPTPTEIPYKVCIDAGHGDWDGGAVLIENGQEVQIEKDDNLRMALLFQEALKEYGVQMILTRDSDVYLELKDRIKIANDYEADLFISFHRNSYASDNQLEMASIKGVEFWLSNTKPENVINLAEKMMAALQKCGITKSRGIKFGSMSSVNENYAVNQYTKMPSILLELGFVTNAEDNKNVNEKGEEYAKALAGVVFEWLKAEREKKESEALTESEIEINE